ncbi:MAG: gliding motility lipoprotein GldH [Bacteroidota bacterium]|nr:gliding motility lipoprotein GldH [Bacteroidota bacterium]
MLRSRFFIFAGLILALVSFSSCEDNSLYDENRDINEGVWDMNQKLSFDFDVPDTVTKYNLYFNIRNTDDYQFRNIYVFFKTTFPNGKTSVDTVEFPLADPVDGRWYGKGQGDVHDCRLVFRQGVRFALPGNYHMEVEQAMRMEQLPGVLSAGIRIERAEE